MRMKDIFFVSVPEAALNPDRMAAAREAIEFVNHEIMQAGIIPNEVYAGWAVHQKASDNPEFGAVVSIEDAKMAKTAALFLKERLRPGTYMLAFNQSLDANEVFRTCVDFNPSLEIDKVAKSWAGFAKLTQSTYGAFVPALMYEDAQGINIWGNLNQTTTGKFSACHEALEKVIHCMNIDDNMHLFSPIFEVINT